MTGPCIVWVGDELRLDDNPALAAADGRPALFVYIYDEGGRPLGGASKWWLNRSLAAFAEALAAKGGRLDVIRGAAGDVMLALARAARAEAVFWGRRYDGYGVETQTHLKAALKAEGVLAQSFNTKLLREPWEVATDNGQPYKVFTPFWRRHRASGPYPEPSPAPKRFVAADWPDAAPRRTSLAKLELNPNTPDWSAGLDAAWTPGEAGAQARLAAFLDHSLDIYADGRDRLDRDATSRLSPHLRFGEISPRRIAGAIETRLGAGEIHARGAEKFLSELAWREFSYSLLFHFPELATRAWRHTFAHFVFRNDDAGFRAWANGKTGYPVVDAAMRELWTTGSMHNRARMIAASFLIKHLLIDWRRGEAWFWDTLCDADPANNPAGWQWVAGSGADAAPYFRIFNPVLQGRKFDPDGAYVRRYVPELASLDADVIHEPWRADAATLRRAGVQLGVHYPEPIVAHDFARARALEALKRLSASPA